jgi:hypothetical protein
MRYTLQMTSDGMICIPSFIKIGSGIQVILRLYLRYLISCNVGITDGGDS